MDIRERYQKVRELARRGATEGERAAAREALARMEQAHPELAEMPQPETAYTPGFSWRVTYYWSAGDATTFYSGSTTNTVSW